jgi:hypothetical protein
LNHRLIIAGGRRSRLPLRPLPRVRSRPLHRQRSYRPRRSCRHRRRQSRRRPRRRQQSSSPPMLRHHHRLEPRHRRRRRILSGTPASGTGTAATSSGCPGSSSSQQLRRLCRDIGNSVRTAGSGSRQTGIIPRRAAPCRHVNPKGRSLPRSRIRRAARQRKSARRSEAPPGVSAGGWLA